MGNKNECCGGRSNSFCAKRNTNSLLDEAAEGEEYRR